MSIFNTQYTLKESLSELFERDIRKLAEEISLYRDEPTIWRLEPGINNSAGNLCLHLIGNLNHFIGAVLAKTGYIRNRDTEFTAKNVSREELLSELDKTAAVCTSALNDLNIKDFEKEYPLEKHGKPVTTGHMLIHLLAHFNYHLGQVNYHRRMIQQEID